MANRLFIILFIIIATLGYAVFQSLLLDKRLAGDSVLQTNSVLKTLPSVSYKIFSSDEILNVNSLNINNHLVVHFWATWCGPCEVEFPDISKLVDKFKARNDIKFLFVSVNDNSNDIAKFLKKFTLSKNNIFVLEDSKYLSQKLFGTYKLPETFIFEKGTGKLIKKFSGPQKWENSYYDNFLNSLSI